MCFVETYFSGLQEKKKGPDCEKKRGSDMLNYDLKKREGKSIYENLYECLKKDIVTGRLRTGEKLPSKRAMAGDYGISVKTVVHAYEQLVAEGYIESKEKKGYYIAKLYEQTHKIRQREKAVKKKKDQVIIDFSSNHLAYKKFPFSVWKKVMREVLTDYEGELIESTDWRGVPVLRDAITQYLARERGLDVPADHIVIGTGVESLYGKLFKIFPKDSVYAAEPPGYRKIPWLYEDAGLPWHSVKMDEEGINMIELKESNANIVHVSPEHQYPLGITMSEKRKLELLEWAAEIPDRYIIEDDYDCEFRYRTQMEKTLQSMDTHHRVIYMNTFGKTMAPAIRINYMILPEKLAEDCKKMSERFPSPVSSFEQYVMAKFIKEEYFERHVRRMKKYYEDKGKKLLHLLQKNENIPITDIKGGKHGTHILLKLNTEFTDTELIWEAGKQGIKLQCLSQFCTVKEERYDRTLILNYSDLEEERLEEAVKKLEKIFVTSVVISK